VDYGLSEERIGKYISNRRSEYYIASKCGCVVGAAPSPAGQRNPHIFTPENIVAGVEQSLKRMKTDYMDVVQFHSSPSKTVLEENEAVEALVRLKEQGKIRLLGTSSTLPNIKDHIEMGVFDVFQIPYSALERAHENIVTQTAKSGAGTVIRGGVAKGGPSEDKNRSDAVSLWDRARLDDILDGMSRMEFMMRFTLSHPDMHTTIVGTINPKHLQDNLNAAANGPLPKDVYEEAKRRLAEAGETPA
jgi:aryl-alcohol dehydrogenase-like predicted oxidoreductase